MAPGKLVDPDLVGLVFRCFAQNNRSYSAVGRLVGKSYKGVQNIIVNYDESTKKRKVAKPKGRPRATTTEQDVDLLRFVQANRDLSGTKITVEVGLGHKTLLNRLRDFKARRSKAVLDELTQEHEDTRVFWCLIQRELLLENPTMFHEVIFSDEVRFNLHGGKIECWYLKGENRHDKDLQVPVATLIKGGIMLWGAITATGPVALIRVDGRINSDVYEDTLFERLPRFLDKHGRDLTFQQDKCPIHTSRKMGQFFWREGIEND
ncbi:hypothetical protein RvY_12000 [Ramazzottius varieornatus]|uniref:Tc1-like transposase DDE domain-containing protein n=1 Tax=Ramazzottius varieornatus TaxID=947166 RepID=A0A1D1VK17_RAMVA|nr:hypothetical protein RvY_12000 [Ramazzottius varieornatus]